jgi:hypothetical protein
LTAQDGDDTAYDLEPILELPPDLVVLLEFEVVAVTHIDVFWERQDAIRGLLPTGGSEPPDDLEARWERAGDILPAELLEALRPVIFGEDDDPPDPDDWETLSMVLNDWEVLRVDPEKMLGHLARAHRLPPQTLVDLDLDELTRRHSEAHHL